MASVLATYLEFWMADRRRCHGLDTVANCQLCDQELEMPEHVLVSCSFTRQVWSVVLAYHELSLSDLIALDRTWARQRGKCSQGLME